MQTTSMADALEALSSMEKGRPKASARLRTAKARERLRGLVQRAREESARRRR